MIRFAPAMHADSIWGDWGAPLTVVVPLLLLLASYAHGLVVLTRRAGRGVVAPWRSAAFAGGAGSLALALLSPVDALASQLLSAHMVQHLLLVLVAPSLLVVARPALPLHASIRALDVIDRAGLHRLRGARRWRLSARTAPAIALAWAVHIAVVLAWHLPVSYDAALRSDLVHAAEHVTMLASALVAWWTALGPGTRRRRGVAVLCLAAAGSSGGLLAALLTFSGRPWYPAYERTAPLWGLTGLQDQQLAGALMWVVGGAMYLVVSAGLFAHWIVVLERRPGGSRSGG